MSGCLPHSDDDLQMYREAAQLQRKTALAQLPWWQQLDIDWTEFHPAARILLDDPFFWDCTDGYSPHGNDTGADLIDEFVKWRKSHTQESPQSFLSQLLDQWGISIAWQERPIASWNGADALAVSLYNE